MLSNLETQNDNGFEVRQTPGRTVVRAHGEVVRGRGQKLACLLGQLDAYEHPQLTIDLREATSVDALVVHALLRAWEARDRRCGSISILLAPGDVNRYFDGLNLSHALDYRVCGVGLSLPVLSPEAAAPAFPGMVAHLHRLLAAARRQDLHEFREVAHQGHALCLAAGAPDTDYAFGSWCERCPVHAAYGGCRTLVDRMVNDAARGNWEATQLLILTLIGEVVGLDPEAVEGELTSEERDDANRAHA